MYIRLKNLREDKDLSQCQIAQYLHCSQSAYSRIESGNPNFKLKLATQKKFTWRLVVQAFFRVVVNPIFDKSYFFRSRFLGSFR
ncbi:putative transcriptional regulator, Cro/CI family [Streptococcus pneumoniae]|nr:putative transcriptional regulator, Cro/CI family [Streptococcus pneumoniae]